MEWIVVSKGRYISVKQLELDCYDSKKSCYSKKVKIRNRYNQVPHPTQSTTWESDENTRKHHIQESQEVSLFPAGDHRAAVNRQESMTNTKHK